VQEKNINRFSVLMSGLGGQGLLTMGKVLAQAGCSYYRYVTYHPNYGPSMRGGECECTVTLSNKENTSIASRNPSAAILMGAGAWMLHEAQVKPGGLLLVDSSIVTDRTIRDDVTVHYIPATQMALELGSAMVSNLILLSAYLEVTKALPLEAIEKALKDKYTGTKGERFLPIDLEAIKLGAKFITDSQTGGRHGT
jgi:2-oxoglutarate ferredoxin oxidoreductase subunit gamma